MPGTLAATATLLCPGCKEPNTVTYAFPQGYVEET